MIFKKNNRSPLAYMQLFNTLYTSSQLSHRPCIDPFYRSKLLSSYFKVGKIVDAQKLFDEIPEKNIVFWSIMVHGYAKNGLHVKSLESLWQMRVSGLFVNSFTIVGVLVGVMGLRDLVLGQTVHGLSVKSGLDSDPNVCTAMVDTYAKCGNIHESYKLFEVMRNPGLVSWNVIIAGFQYNELFEEALIMFNRFRRSSLIPNAATTLTLLRVCVALDSHRLCESIHCLIIKFGLDSDIAVSNSVLDMYSRLMDLDGATKLFDGMECKDVISWNTMIGLLVSLENASDALKLFGKMRMRDSDINHDALVIINLISACGALGDLKRGKQAHAQAVVCGYGSELQLVNTIVAMYSKCGDLDSSKTVFDQTTGKSLVSWTAMIAGCAQNGYPRQALNLLTKLRTEGAFCFDSIMLISALTASGDLALIELCQQLHCYAFEAGFLKHRMVPNSLISTYSKCANVGHAHNVFLEMDDLRDIVSWNSIINGYGINSHGETALALFHEMRENGKDPDSATYLSILSACSHSGMVDDGLMIFNQMVKDNRTKPSQEHYGCVIDLLARAGCLSDASAFVNRTLKGMDDLNAWRALLNGCLLHGNTGLAELAAKRVFELDPDDPSQVVLLSNVYASVGRFQDAESLRSSMSKKALIKNPGISLLNEIPYDFG